MPMLARQRLLGGEEEDTQWLATGMLLDIGGKR